MHLSLTFCSILKVKVNINITDCSNLVDKSCKDAAFQLHLNPFVSTNCVLKKSWLLCIITERVL